MNFTGEPRLAPPVGLRNGCGPHTSSATKQTANASCSSPYVLSTVSGGYHNNVSHPYYYQKQQQRSSLHDDVMQMFDKCFLYQKPTEAGNVWSLPPADELFSEYYQLDSLQQLKIKLNDVKSKLNDYVIEDWSQHTRRKDPAGEIPWRLKSEVKAEFVTIAWCKLFECLGRFPSLVKGPCLNSLHLCEAPGAFIAALNHYLHSKYDKTEIQWNWLATTLNPYYEGNPVTKMIMDDRFMLFTLNNWLFHKDFTGNIIDIENLEHMKQKCLERMGEVHLITADGSIDCIDAPDWQEEKVAILHFAEILAALEILTEGGSFVVKMFTLFEASSIDKLYLLNCAFENVHIFKPCTSKRGNSEVYVICLNYQKASKNLKEVLQKMKEKLSLGNAMMGPLFPKSSLPSDFLMKHEIVCRFFMNYQINAIESNIASYEIKPSKYSIKCLQVLRSYVSDEYLRRYKVRTVAEELKILYKYQGNIEKSYKTHIYHGSHSEREMLKETTKEEQIFKLRKQLNDLERMMTDLYVNGQTISDFKRSEESLPSRILKPYRGKIIDTLNSTLFANVHLLVMRSKLNNFQSHDVLWHNNPRIEFPQETFVLNFNDFTGSPPIFSQQQKLFFISLMENLLKFKPTLIKFINMPFLTHYAASILRYLSVTSYEQLTFKFHDTFEVVLDKTTQDFTKSLEDLSSIIKSSPDDTDQNILCFIDILELHHNDFNKTLITYNNMLLLQKFKSILDN